MAETADKMPENGTNDTNGTTVKSKILSAAFNIAAGAAAAFTAKTVAAAVFATCLPAVGTIAVTSVAVGAAVATTSWYLKKRKAEKQGFAAPDFWSKDTGKTFLLSTALAGVGGALFAYFSGAFDSCVTATPEPSSIPDTSPDNSSVSDPADSLVPPVEPQIPETADVPEPASEPEIEPAPEAVPDPDTDAAEAAAIEPEAGAAAPFACGDVTAAFNAWAAAGGEVSARVAESLARAEAGSAQGVKDLGFFLFNGFDGVEQNRELAVKFFECAAQQGNVQAQVDLAYAQYHGLGTEAQPEAALSAMQDIGSRKAEWFVQQWTGGKAASL
ncbi:MAG: hypothetical protein EA357_10005 [Micavibrio sp.]|nr:MAG: hypothetical protein EA357_10005 [Micavibrio sp.]